MVKVSEEVYFSLRRRFKGDLLRPGQSGYEEARTIWNGMVARSPGLIARCTDVSDVKGAVRAASEIGIPAGWCGRDPAMTRSTSCSLPMANEYTHFGSSSLTTRTSGPASN